MSNIHGLFSGEKKEEKDKRSVAYNGNGAETISPDAGGFDAIVGKAKAGGESKKGDDKTDVKITLYNNGFIVDEGEFRDYSDEGNKKFMEDMKAGYVPEEIRKKYNRQVGVALEDRRKEDFKKPPPPYNPWGG